MTVVLEAARPRPAIPQAEERTDATEALEHIIAAHRAALLALAPHQEDRAARVETGWHMEHLGLLLGHRDSAMQRGTQNPAPSGVRLPERGRENTSADSLRH